MLKYELHLEMLMPTSGGHGEVCVRGTWWGYGEVCERGCRPCV